MARCAQVSGSYRCMFDFGHSGPCEAQAPEYAMTAATLRAQMERDYSLMMRRIEILESQMLSVQMALPKGIP